jgi:hypothetical protein
MPDNKVDLNKPPSGIGSDVDPQTDSVSVKPPGWTPPGWPAEFFNQMQEELGVNVFDIDHDAES